MRFMQTSDLHLGKKLRERSLDEDQRFILKQIVDLAVEHKVDGLIVAGDVFDDGSNTTADAVTMLDEFFNDLSDRDIETYIISGNHDSMDRLAYGKEFFGMRGIHIVSQLEREMVMYTRREGNLTVDIYMLPFMKPIHARRLYEDESIKDYNDAVAAAIGHASFPEGDRFRILVTHQFVTAAGITPEKSESEKVYVGNTENVDSSLFEKFDYVALGHIHKAQDIGDRNVHYCGAPLKYSVSEHSDTKSVTIVDIDEDGFTKTIVPLKPMREVRLVTGPLDMIVDAAKKDRGNNDLVYAKLTDSPENAVDRLREVFPNLLGVETPTTGEDVLDEDLDIEEGIDAVSAFCEFYRKCKNEPMTDEQLRIVEELLSEGGSE